MREGQRTLTRYCQECGATWSGADPWNYDHTCNNCVADRHPDESGLPTLAEEFEHIDREAARFQATRRFAPIPGPQAIILTHKGEEIGVAFGLDRVYSAYFFLPFDSWHYSRGNR
jgi:hypothetical protein